MFKIHHEITPSEAIGNRLSSHFLLDTGHSRLEGIDGVLTLLHVGSHLLLDVRQRNSIETTAGLRALLDSLLEGGQQGGVSADQRVSVRKLLFHAHVFLALGHGMDLHDRGDKLIEDALHQPFVVRGAVVCVLQEI